MDCDIVVVTLHEFSRGESAPRYELDKHDTGWVLDVIACQRGAAIPYTDDYLRRVKGNPYIITVGKTNEVTFKSCASSSNSV